MPKKIRIPSPGLYWDKTHFLGSALSHWGWRQAEQQTAHASQTLWSVSSAGSWRQTQPSPPQPAGNGRRQGPWHGWTCWSRSGCCSPWSCPSSAWTRCSKWNPFACKRRSWTWPSPQVSRSYFVSFLSASPGYQSNYRFEVEIKDVFNRKVLPQFGSS